MKKRIARTMIPGKTRHWPNVCLMLARPLQRWPIIDLTLVECLVVLGLHLLSYCFLNTEKCCNAMVVHFFVLKNHFDRINFSAHIVQNSKEARTDFTDRYPRTYG